MKKYIKKRLFTYSAIILILILVITEGNIIYQTLIHTRQRETDHILHFYSENIMLQLQGKLNEADSLVQMAYVANGTDTTWFEKATASLLERDEVRYACLIKGDTIVSALPRSIYGNQIGRDLKTLSYIYTLAKVVKEPVVEGPVVINEGENEHEVFLFLQPIVENNAYLGEVAVALDRNFVLEQLGLDYLLEQGYDYELWRVEQQHGGKEIIKISKQDLDFSNAVKTTFYLPTEWNLSIQPKNGWITPTQKIGIIIICCITAVLLLVLTLSLHKLLIQNRTLKKLSLTDHQTGLYNRLGFTEMLDQWLLEDNTPVILFYFVFEGYNQVSQIIDPQEEAAFLKNIPLKIKEFIQNPFIAGRLGECNFAVAVREDMDTVQQKDFAKGLTLELLLKVRLDGKKKFLAAHYQYSACRMGKVCAEEEIKSLIHSYYLQRSGESPAKMLTHKCRQLIEGKNDVSFDEYMDVEMTELSKTFNQYRKQVEQLAYFDPIFNVGNRPKYMRDANMLISYDKKRRFGLFCVDICSFSQYNQLFSTDIGDEILHEVIHRLSRLFGTYLYRINGDVFLGISLTNENEELFAAKIQKLLSTPVFVGNTSFVLQVRIAICCYPADGTSPDLLLDRIQSVLRYAKISEQKIVIYNDALSKIIRTETNILHRLKSAIQHNTLEVWYQPLMNLETNHFTAAEALVRLPDGKGGYFSAGQVITLAERSGMVEQLGDYVLNRACHFMRSFGRTLGLSHICVNLSVQQLLVGNSAEHLLDIIHASGVTTSQVTLEITESILIQSIEQVSKTLNKLRRTGIRIALDDFGVGYSSLNYLSSLPVDIIKIDRSLIQQIRTNCKQHALLNSIVEMAKINSLSVVSEGVETIEEQKLISTSGVQYIQGFYYARPMPEKELIHFLNEKNELK